MDARPSQRVGVDVLVVGGGATGVAAATTAARAGLKTLVVERYGFCGGGAVAGLSGTVCGLYEAEETPREPKKIVFGFVDDFIKAMEQRGGLSAPMLYGKTWTRVHEPLAWRDSADALLMDAGVRISYHSLAIGVHRNGDRIDGATIWTKGGLLDVRAGLTIDASGDADVVAMAGLQTYCGADGVVQNPTMIFRLQGVDTQRFKAAYGADTILPPEVSEMIASAAESGYALPRTKIWLFETTRPGELLCNCTRVRGADGRELNCINADDFTEAEIQGRKQAREYARFFKDKLAGCEASWLNDTAVQVGVRQTRQARGTALLRNEDVVRGSKFTDGVARSPWPIELHAGAKPRVSWLLNDYYEIPYGCFVPERGEGLLFGGRCLSAEHEAVASARVTAQCFSYGHALGVAATVALRERVEPRAIPGAAVRDLLNRQGARLDG
ncbi:MAG: FAD-dependent oxidoreductase [Methylibium sp.]|uniref:FAD-dependent oxidoreductase n=1 Tax=Methylibium sp. TaxID=2067992 RepID=UPI001810318D|nr:FAD-dependent oxidoreductase [Methylibium sp.]MBA3596461.1 FAD-dependent oxidoreductase [Methylibium sp.]